ncbi:hypothetical protein KY334_02855 [Candidatus Woesearchaeota archaeon]|nr:hypothetical protein [Candidatus Woesearchaeota archaeon]
MEIIITNKAAYSIIFILIFSLFVVVADASEFIDINEAYHSLEQLVDSKNGKIDLDENGQVDNADLARGVRWIDVKHMAFECPENTYLVGYDGNAPICRKIGLLCEVSYPTIPICVGQNSVIESIGKTFLSSSEAVNELNILDQFYEHMSSGEQIGMNYLNEQLRDELYEEIKPKIFEKLNDEGYFCLFLPISNLTFNPEQIGTKRY